jgi:hypothetical protein
MDSSALLGLVASVAVPFSWNSGVLYVVGFSPLITSREAERL